MAMQAILILIIQRSLSVKLLLFSQMDLSNLGFHRSEKRTKFSLCMCTCGVFWCLWCSPLPDPARPLPTFTRAGPLLPAALHRAPRIILPTRLNTRTTKHRSTKLTTKLTGSQATLLPTRLTCLTTHLKPE